MGDDALGTLIMIGVAVFAPYAAAAMGLTGFAATAFSFVLQAGASALLGGIMGDKRGGGGGVADSGFMINQNGNTAAIPVIYGKRRIGGTRVYLETTDASGNPSGTEYLHIAMVVAQGGIHPSGTDDVADITAIYLNDRVAWTSAGGVDEYFSGLIELAVYTGKNNQTLLGAKYKTSAISSNWMSSEWLEQVSGEYTHRLRGISYVYMRLKYDRDKFPGAPTIFADVTGKRIQAVHNLGTWTDNYTEMQNPANIVYDYLTNERYGKGLSPADLDIDSFIAARSWAIAAGVKLNGAIDTADTIFNNVQKILSCGNLNLVYVNGKYSVQPLKQESFAGAFEFNTSNIIGQWTISLGSKKTRFNQALVNFFNPRTDSDIIGEQWQPDSRQITNDAYVAEDSGLINQKSFDLPLLSDPVLVERMTNFLINNSRYQTIVNFRAVHSALKLQVGDPVYVTHPVPGWTQRKFRVNSIVLQQDSTVEVTLEAYAPDSIYLENNL